MKHRPGHKVHCRDTELCASFANGYERGRQAKIKDSTVYQRAKEAYRRELLELASLRKEVAHLREFSSWLQADRDKIEAHRQKLLAEREAIS